MKHFLEWAAIAALGVLVRRLDDDEADALARFMGKTGYRFLRWRREITLRHLRAAWGGKFPEPEAETVARKAFAHFAAVGLEILRFPLLSREECRRRVRVEGWEPLARAHARGKGVLLCAAHFGNWELAALHQGWRGLPMTMLTRRLDNPRLESMLMALRTASGNVVVHKRRSTRNALRALNEGGIVVIVMDQSYRGADAVLAPFLGRPAPTSPIAALLALRTEAAVFAAVPVREGFNRYRMFYEPCLPPARAGNLRADVENFTRDITAHLEDYVRRFPEQWLWMHERWRGAEMFLPSPAEGAPLEERAATL